MSVSLGRINSQGDFAYNFALSNCATWPRLFNCWMAFLVWTVMVTLAFKLQVSASTVKALIEKRNLFSNKQEKQIMALFGALYIPSCITLVAYMIFTIDYKQQNNIHKGEVIFAALNALLIGVLTVVFVYGLWYLQSSIQLTEGIQISRKMQVLNIVAMVTLLAISIANAFAWSSTKHIITVSMVQLYCNYPCKILFVVIAQ